MFAEFLLFQNPIYTVQIQAHKFPIELEAYEQTNKQTRKRKERLYILDYVDRIQFIIII